MNIEVSEIEYCKVAVHAEIEPDHIKEKRIEVLSEFKKLPVPGFRTGKASLDAVKHRYKNQIDARLREVLAEDAFNGSLNEKNLKPLGNPEFSLVNLNSNGFVCDFTLKIKPTIELQQYKEFSLPKPNKVISAEEFTESLLQNLREQNGSSVPFTDDDFIQTGDSVIVDYVASIDGVERPELSATKELVHVGKSPLPNFDDNILGMKNGDFREFDVPAPENASKDYAGKTLTFKVTLVMGSKQTPAPLDDSFAQRLNFKSLDELRAHATSVANSRVEEHDLIQLKQQIASRLLENHIFEIPSWLSVAEAQYVAQRSKLKWDEITDEQKQNLITAAERSVRLSLLLEKIREKEIDAQLSDEELQKHIYSEIVKIGKTNNPKDVEKLLTQISNSGMLPILAGKIRDEFALEVLVKTCSITE